MGRLRILLLLLAALAARGASIKPPDPSAGNVDGHTGVLFWPSTPKTWTDHELLPPEGCSVRLVPATDRDAELGYPCGKWFRPPPNRYRVWVESDRYVSVAPTIMQYADLPFDGRGMMTEMPVMPSSIVKLADGVQLSETQSFRLLSLNDVFLGHRMKSFDRRVPRGKRSAAVPAGKALAAMFDRATNDAISLTRPFDAPAGATVTVRPVPPPKDSDVLVIMERPLSEANFDLALLLNGARAPDVFSQTVDRVIAVWYHVAGRSAELTARSPRLHLAPVTLALKPQRVTTFRGKLAPLPRLSASVDAPRDALPKIEISVRKDSDVVAHADVPLAGSVVFDSVPAERLRVTVSADPWQFEKDVDLRDGNDGVVSFRLQPIVLRGTLYLGDAPSPGRLTFELSNKTMRSVTVPDDGAYETTVWAAGTYVVHIVPRGDPNAFVEFPEIDGDRRLDFHVPKNRVTIRVVDEVSGRGISGATVQLLSTSQDPARGAMRVAHPYAADDDGRVVLPRMRIGLAELRAFAPRYTDSEPRQLSIEATTEQEISIPLRREDASMSTRVILPDGGAAIGAEAMLIGASGDALWRGSADADGALALPNAPPATTLIVRAATAGSVAVPMPVGDSIQLPAASSTAFVLHSVNSDGDVVPFAIVSLWLDGVHLDGDAVAFAAWAFSTTTDNRAEWHGRNLPPGARLLAIRRTSPARSSASAYETQAVAVGSSRDIKLTVIE